MSRKHYREVANMINDELNSLIDLTEVEQAAGRAVIISLAGNLSGMFYRDNHLFNSGMFLEACGIE